jgi:hypothetical protein
MKWNSVKHGLPDKDCLCVVYNKARPFSFYISMYSAYFKEFEVNTVGCMIRLPDAITFNATHWMELISPELESTKDNL